MGLSLAWVLTQRMQAPPETAAAGAILGVSAGSLLSLLTLTVWTLRSGRSDTGTDVPDGRRFILRRLLEIGIPVTLGSAGMSLVTLLDQSVSMGVLQRSLGLSVEVANGLYGEYSFALTLFALPPSFIYPVSISLVPAVSGRALPAGSGGRRAVRRRGSARDGAARAPGGRGALRHGGADPATCSTPRGRRRPRRRRGICRCWAWRRCSCA